MTDLEYNSYACGRCTKSLSFLPAYQGPDANLYFFILSLQYGKQGERIPVYHDCVKEMITSPQYSISTPEAY